MVKHCVASKLPSNVSLAGCNIRNVTLDSMTDIRSWLKKVGLSICSIELLCAKMQDFCYQSPNAVVSNAMQHQ